MTPAISSSHSASPPRNTSASRRFLGLAGWQPELRQRLGPCDRACQQIAASRDLAHQPVERLAGELPGQRRDHVGRDPVCHLFDDVIPHQRGGTVVKLGELR